MRDFNLKVAIIILSLTQIISSCSDDSNDVPEIVEEETFVDIYEPDNSFKVVGYLPHYRFSKVESIDFSKLNYVNIAFGNPNAGGNITVGNGVNIQSVVSKIKNDGCKVMISVAGGGLTDAQENIWKNLLSEGNVKNTVAKMVAYVEQHNLDGVDVDIEGSLLTDLGNNYNVFVAELKKQLHAKGKAITAAVYATSVRSNVTNATLRSYDFLNIMIYDERGLWNVTNVGPHSSYDFALRAVDFWKSTQGISAEKLVFGMPFYGVNFDPSNLGYETYGTVVAENSLHAYSDQVDFLYYNGIPTIRDKSILALEQTNGIMIWELGQDSFDSLSLLNVIYEVLTEWPCNGSEIQTYFADDDEDGYGNHLAPIQACTQPEGYVGNNLDPDDGNSLVF